MKKVRETLEECIARVGTFRCVGNFDSGTIGLRHKQLPAIVAMCAECAKKTNVEEECPDGFEIVRTAA